MEGRLHFQGGEEGLGPRPRLHSGSPMKLLLMSLSISVADSPATISSLFSASILALLLAGTSRGGGDCTRLHPTSILELGPDSLGDEDGFLVVAGLKFESAIPSARNELDPGVPTF